MLNNSHFCFDLFARNVFVASHGGTVGSESIHTPLLGQGIQIRIFIQSVQVRSVKGVCKIDLG